MAYSYVSYTSTGGQTYNVPFPYLEAAHVKVYINGVETSAFTWSDAATIHLNVAPAVGATILIKRETPRDGMDYTFSAQPRLKGDDLDDAFKQTYYVGLEALDQADSAILDAAVSDAQAAQAAAEGARDTALVAQGAAEAAEDAAVVAQGLAEDAADLAATYANNAGAGTYAEVSSAPTTDANEVKLYAKEVTGVAELFIRKESNGAEIQVTSGSILNGTPPDASEETKGIAELATQTEVNAGTDDARIVTPLKLRKYTGLRGMKNIFINGGMQVAQRVVDQTLDGSIRYGRVDRWHAFWNSGTGVTSGAQSQANTTNLESYTGATLTGLTCTGTNTLFFGQRIEAVNARRLYKNSDYGGVSVRFRVWHDFGVNVNIACGIYTANTTDTFSTITNRVTTAAQSVPTATWTTLKFEGLNLGSTDVEKGIVVYLVIDTPICSGKTMYFGDAQLELGAVCTDSEHRQYGFELNLCQRYALYCNQYFLGLSKDATHTGNPSNWPVPMRVAPTMLSSPTPTFTVGSGSAGTPAVGNLNPLSGMFYNSANNWSTSTTINVTCVMDAEL